MVYSDKILFEKWQNLICLPNTDNRGEGARMKSKQLIGLFALSLIVIACAQTKVQNFPPVNTKTNSSMNDYFIHAGDELEVKFFYNPELNERVFVRPDGMITLQLIDDIKVDGLTPADLDSKLTKLYSSELRKPVLSVFVRTFGGQRIYVGGEVNQQGLVSLTAGMTALQAVMQSGGFRVTAEPSEALVIRKGEDNKPIPIRVNLNSSIEGNAGGEDFTLKSEDIVYIPKSAIAKANQFVNQYIEQLLLFRGVSLGFGYQLNDNGND